MGHFITILCLRLKPQPRIFQVNSLRRLVENQTIKTQSFVLPLKSLMVLSQSTQISFYDISDFMLFERFLVKPSFDDFFLERVVILTHEDEIVGLLIRTVSSFVQMMPSFQSRNRCASRSFVLLDDLIDAIAICGGVGCYFVAEAELVGLAVEQIRVGLYFVLSFEGFVELFLVLAQNVTHFNCSNFIS